MSLTISEDGLAAFFASNRTGGPGSYDLWSATRPAADAAFGAAAIGPFDLIDDDSDQRDPELSPDSTRLYLIAGSGALGLITTSIRLDAKASFGADSLALTLPLGTAVRFSHPTTALGGELLAFALFDDVSAQTRIEFATRSDVDGSLIRRGAVFGGAPPPWSDGDPELRDDGCELFWTSNRDGLDTLYRARLPEGP